MLLAPEKGFASAPVRLILAMDLPLSRSRFQTKLLSIPGITLTATTSNLTETYHDAEHYPPDMVLVSEALSQHPEFEVLLSLFGALGIACGILFDPARPRQPERDLPLRALRLLPRIPLDTDTAYIVQSLRSTLRQRRAAPPAGEEMRKSPAEVKGPRTPAPNPAAPPEQAPAASTTAAPRALDRLAARLRREAEASAPPEAEVESAPPAEPIRSRWRAAPAPANTDVEAPPAPPTRPRTGTAALARAPGIVRPSAGFDGQRLLLIGASTGGVEALTQVLSNFPADCPPTLIVQHTGGGFTKGLTRLLDRGCAAHVMEAREGHIPRPGEVLMPPGNAAHLEIVPARGGAVHLRHGPPVSGHRPSVDALFLSALPWAGAHHGGDPHGHGARWGRRLARLAPGGGGNLWPRQ
jgi:chemotaxis response regulator CheB